MQSPKAAALVAGKLTPTSPNSSVKYEFHENGRRMSAAIILTVSVVLLFNFIAFFFNGKLQTTIHELPNSSSCFLTCRLEIVETIPENLSFGNVKLPRTTYSAWLELIDKAERSLSIAAYKSSLQGKHVLGNLSVLYSKEGDDVYKHLVERGKGEDLRISLLENYPPKDKGDNEDGIRLQQRGAAERRYLTVSNILGKGMMHSKFLLADNTDFYIGSANLDWRSLNQKMELGVLVTNCPCMGEELLAIYESYWDLSFGGDKNVLKKHEAVYTKQNPLNVNIANVESEMYIATSPPELNHPGRTWDLDAIVETINSAQKFLFIHVMDYFPLFIYRSENPLPWNVIDDAIRAAAVRGVEVKMLTAALHYPRMGTAFLRSLQALDNITSNSSLEARIFKVPTPQDAASVINRERRTHNKFVVTESTVIIGTSNWSGDYFDGGTTGLAFIINQRGERRPLIDELKGIFQRDFNSAYAHPVEEYYQSCIVGKKAPFCEREKDPNLFATTPSQ